MDASFSPRRSHPDGATFREWRAPDGWVHRRMDWPQPDGAKARGTLLFAGGRGDFIEKYLEVYRHWHGRGWDLVAFDWRGQGLSRGNIAGGHLDDFGAPVGDLDALIADVRASGSSPFVAVAHSMGGHLLLRTLIERRPALDAAVLIAPMVEVNSAPLPPRLAAAIAGTLSKLGWARRPVWSKGGRPRAPETRRNYLTTCPDRYADELWWWDREPGFNLGTPSWGWLAAAYRSAAKWFTPDRLKQVAVPLLIVATASDRLVSARAIREAADHIPDAALHMVEGAAHEILREPDPIRLDALARIDAFLDERAG